MIRRPFSHAGSEPGALPRVLLIGAILVAAVLAISSGLVAADPEWALAGTVAVAVFVIVFVRTEFGLYILLLSMLLSPEIILGGKGGLAERREIALRMEDLLLFVIALTWLGKTAVNKELGLIARTPLNPAILAYIFTQLLATLWGMLTGSVTTIAGLFYVVKYVEYFFVYYMVVNNLRDKEQTWRLVATAFLTAAIVSANGIMQIPTGRRISAPFEGAVGEPNTLGGYLLLMIAIGAGIVLETQRYRIRFLGVGLLLLMGVPFMYTLSRASYLGFIPMVLALTVLTSRRRLMLGVLAVTLAFAPIVMRAAPEPVTRRIEKTFRPERHLTTVEIGGVAFDPSTSQRLFAFKQATEAWMLKPFLGYGVTGFRFVDAQYPRVLVESGVIGFAAFAWLVWLLFREGLTAYRTLADPEERGLALGFLAGLVGLLVHAVGSNTFIIVRIMEPFWFFAAVVITLTRFEIPETAPPSRLARW